MRDSGVTSSPAKSGVYAGSKVLELRGGTSYVVRELGDLTSAGEVTVSFYGAVSSLDYNYYNPEYMDMDFYDGQEWHNGVVRFTRSDNDKGYRFKTWTVPEEWVSGDNRIRFSARANYNNDYF